MVRLTLLAGWLVVAPCIVPLHSLADPLPSPEEPVNFCHEPTSWHEWDALVRKHPADQGLQTLHALRIGLCVKVDRGDVTVEEATLLFEQARAAVIRHSQEERRQAGERPRL